MASLCCASTGLGQCCLPSEPVSDERKALLEATEVDRLALADGKTPITGQAGGRHA
jgi:hypothetical protein